MKITDTISLSTRLGHICNKIITNCLDNYFLSIKLTQSYVLFIDSCLL